MDDRQVIIFFKSKLRPSWNPHGKFWNQRNLIIYHPGGGGEGAEHGQRSWLPYRVGRGDGGKFHPHLFFYFPFYFPSIFLSEWGMEECILLAFSSLFLNISPSLSFPQFILFNDHSPLLSTTGVPASPPCGSSDQVQGGLLPIRDKYGSCWWLRPWPCPPAALQGGDQPGHWSSGLTI